MSTHPDELPDFASWDRKVLDKYATEAYQAINEQQALIAQLKQDFKDCMKINRERIAKE